MATTIGNYILERELGQGGFGHVYLATRRSDGLKVAIKLLRMANDEHLRRFYREAKLLYQHLSDPNVVDILEWGFDADPAYIVMEFCSGGSLRAWVGRAMEWNHVCAAMAQACTGLAGIHKVNGFHRDIKPDNILLAAFANNSYIVKLADFGLARHPEGTSGPMTRSPFGTPGYFAPELLLGAPYDARCDIYSLGVTAVELLTGSRDPISIAVRRDIPTGLGTLLQRMTNQNPQVRPMISHCLSEFSRLSVVQATAPQARPQRQAQPQRQPPAQRQPQPQPQGTSATGGGLFGGLVLLLGGLALATMNKRDANGNFHGSDGRYRSSRWG
jgi:serine/threonine protein kinase